MIVYILIIKGFSPNLKRYEQIFMGKFAFSFWVSNGSMKLSICACWPVQVISHIVDLEKLFPDNELLKNDHI